MACGTLLGGWAAFSRIHAALVDTCGTLLLVCAAGLVHTRGPSLAAGLRRGAVLVVHRKTSDGVANGLVFFIHITQNEFDVLEVSSVLQVKRQGELWIFSVQAECKMSHVLIELTHRNKKLRCPCVPGTNFVVEETLLAVTTEQLVCQAKRRFFAKVDVS